MHLQQGYQQASAEAVREVGERNAQLHQCLEEASLSLSQQRLEMGQLQVIFNLSLMRREGLIDTFRMASLMGIHRALCRMPLTS